ncbi:MAG: fluoride efflux transporter CrcB [Flavobacteriales bacterium CG_4_9_14_0_2_um_filter_35_242]|nr:fluoride efflux transporter CrcB [Zetaproteobacteria bacterium]OIO10428.1 MAG: camphor resistance protein CrcB [Flavobacteriaceae bacterium CG1_02_35_72]PIR14415.1 MAG: fluoride efflux transporter CrcB [Flavobacteriales bacterium CG11_big_fil_rev_8_21_14_0_20_35_7]PIV16583.1 MAG: fluoride efflux transporter CrcB [Flavobacteriales bacterium CG03_land_8_20_14_0_80_35_15]PIX06423.1 MAG: fluoride efflux transporter CrcB [Flavobacteriales bacterium CG_4_8_14_3_um_filter_35_10]PJA06089.1 MAG: flu
MKIIALIGIGSFIGGIFRYLLSQSVQSKFLSAYPFGTLTVNIIGCLAIGIVFGLSEKFNFSPEWRLFLATGICGGFTTFSTFSFETMAMLRDGQYLYSFLYIGSSVFVGLIAVYLGILLLKLL